MRKGIIEQHIHAKCVSPIRRQGQLKFGYSKLVDEYGALEVEMELYEMLALPLWNTGPLWAREPLWQEING